MDKSDERKCTSTARSKNAAGWSASKSNQASKQQTCNSKLQLDSKIRANEAFLSLRKGAVFAIKCGGAKARNSMCAYVQIRRDLENRAWQKIQRRVIVKGLKAKQQPKAAAIILFSLGQSEIVVFKVGSENFYVIGKGFTLLSGQVWMIGTWQVNLERIYRTVVNTNLVV